MTLQEESKRIALNLEKLKEELEEQRVAMLLAIDKMSKEYRYASAQGDLRENAAFTEAQSKLSMYNLTLNTIDARLQSIVKGFDSVNYRPIGLVTLFSTLRLRLPGDRSFVFRLYPEGISDVGKGIISIDSPVGKGLWLKEQGSTITITHRITGEPIQYYIEDIY